MFSIKGKLLSLFRKCQINNLKKISSDQIYGSSVEEGQSETHVVFV
jgi:hypothetical protein